MTGQRFGRLTVVERDHQPYAGHDARWRCVCDCGGSTVSRRGSLMLGKAQSCGCLSRELAADRIRPVAVEVLTTHGMTRSPEWITWVSMRARCANPKDRSWPNYGGRGIQVCDEWQKDFAAFYTHIGPRPGPGYSIDRIDNDGNYEPGNVRWATRSEQMRNRRPLPRDSHGRITLRVKT